METVASLWEAESDLYVAFVDMEKVYDRVGRDALWKVHEYIG